MALPELFVVVGRVFIYAALAARFARYRWVVAVRALGFEALLRRPTTGYVQVCVGQIIGQA